MCGFPPILEVRISEVGLLHQRLQETDSDRRDTRQIKRTVLELFKGTSYTKHGLKALESLLLSIQPGDPVWIAVAFGFGMLTQWIGLPPLLGYLIAGFTMHALGAEGGTFLNTIADLGITMLLFSIGLKLRLRDLAKPEVWGPATLHMAIITALFSFIVFGFALLGLPLFIDLSFQQSMLVAFVLSFSSTVFAIKILDELGAVQSKHGQVAIGVLVIQDIAAVVFLAASTGKVPSAWAILLLLLIPLKPLLERLLVKAGHGELLVLFGISIALVGADVFEMVGIKGDVGALILGMMFANHPKASELAKALFSFKNLFLVGFFLSVGMAALPGWNEVLVALLIVVLLPIKVVLFFALFNLFCMRVSSSWRTSLNLANFSEFGLIVGALAVSYGWLENEWLAVFAIALSVSFVISAPLVKIRDRLYTNYRPTLKRLERQKRLTDETDIDLAGASVVIFGMGRMGVAAYESMLQDHEEQIVGVELSGDKVALHQAQNRHVVQGDGTNPDFWNRAQGQLHQIESIMLTLPTHAANLNAALQLKELGFNGFIAATYQFADEEASLKEAGVNMAFNIYAEAGQGFASDLKTIRDAH